MTSPWVVLTLAVVNVVTLMLAAVFFWLLENDTYTPADITQMSFYANFEASNPGVSSADLAAFARAVATAAGDGGVVGNATEQDNDWTFDNAVYFCMTVVTTIGYGHISPVTAGGKAMCVVYAVLAIPLAAALLAIIGKNLRRPLVALHGCRPWYKKNDATDKHIKSAVVLFIGLVVMVCVPAAVFCYTEDWDYLTAVYYATVTLTTVGFGDYVAGSSGALYRVLMCLWLLVGLAFLALIVAEASDAWARSSSKLPNAVRHKDKDKGDEGGERGEEEPKSVRGEREGGQVVDSKDGDNERS